MNYYDQIVRYAAKADADERWALVTEFQAEPDPEMLDRLLEYLARLRRELRHGPERRGRYGVLAALVNLTGPPQPDTLAMALPGAAADRPSLEFRVVVRTLRDEDAAGTLAGIASGAVAPIHLVWVPLMHGGDDPGILHLWKALALAEPDPRRRSMYGAFALILAGLARRKAAWQAALEGWNVLEYPVIDEWKAQWKAEGVAEGLAAGRAEGLSAARREDLRRILGFRFPGALPPVIEAAVAAQADPSVLGTWVDAALASATLDDFRRAIGC